MIYTDGTYLRHNPSWHEEDSPYKASLIARAVRRTRTSFNTCADIGCGAGLVTQILAKQFSAATFRGYDVSPDAARLWSGKSADNLRFICADLIATNEVFDLVLCLDVVEHIEDYLGFLRRLRLKGRRFIFNIPLDMNVAKLLSGRLRVAREEFGHLHYFSRYTALASLTQCGFNIIDAYASAAFLKTLPRNMAQAIALLPRVAVSLLGERIAATLLGGFSLVVTAEPS